MKISYFYIVLSMIAMAILGYWTYCLAHSNNDPNDVVVGIGTAICVIASLGPGISLSLDEARVNVNMKVLCLVAFIVLMVLNFCYAGFGVSMPYYVIILGLFLIAFAGLLKKMTDIKDI